jgi:hypothetical protein
MAWGLKCSTTSVSEKSASSPTTRRK